MPSFEDILIAGIATSATESIRLIDGELTKVLQPSQYQLPLRLVWEGQSLIVEWDSERNELVILSDPEEGYSNLIDVQIN